MAKLDLLKLAKQIVEDDYKEVELSFGKVRIYQVPEPMIWQYKPDRPRPVEPTIAMKLATGGRQSRPIKKGDDGYAEWLQDEDNYENELSDIRLAARYVLALRGPEINYPADLSQPPPMLAQVSGVVKYPDSELLRKKVWLDHSVLAKSVDFIKIQTAMMDIGGDASLDGDVVDDVKKNSELDSTDDQ